jgi:hypothetical protein
VDALDAAIADQRALANGSVSTVAEPVASLLGTQARMLDILGWHDEALATAYRAVTIFRLLEPTAVSEANLARALTNYSTLASELDDGPAALASSAEAVTILSRLTADDPVALEPDFRRALWAHVNVRGTVQVSLDDLRDAVAAVLELVELYTRLSAGDPLRYGDEQRRPLDHARRMLHALRAAPAYRPLLDSPDAAALRDRVGTSPAAGSSEESAAPD